MNGLLQGRVAVITGASRERGIGLATARLFAEHGARVALLDLDPADAQAAAAALGPQHIGLACDVRDAAACRAAIDQATQALAKGTEAFAAERMNRGIQRALAGKNVQSI